MRIGNLDRYFKMLIFSKSQMPGLPRYFSRYCNRPGLTRCFDSRKGLVPCGLGFGQLSVGEIERAGGRSFVLACAEISAVWGHWPRIELVRVPLWGKLRNVRRVPGELRIFASGSQALHGACQFRRGAKRTKNAESQDRDFRRWRAVRDDHRAVMARDEASDLLPGLVSGRLREERGAGPDRAPAQGSECSRAGSRGRTMPPTSGS